MSVHSDDAYGDTCTVVPMRGPDHGVVGQMHEEEDGLPRHEAGDERLPYPMAQLAWLSGFWIVGAQPPHLRAAHASALAEPAEAWREDDGEGGKY